MTTLIQFLEPVWLHALWAVALAAIICPLAIIRRRGAIARFVGSSLAPRAARRAGVRPGRALTRAALLLLALALTAIALARPGWNPVPKPVQRSGRDVVFIVDVSRSMLARDLAPSRLGRAKLMIKDVLDAATGDRFGLIAFAGTAVVKCPLTTDYNFASIVVDDLSPDSVSRGGTLIGDAIRTAMETLFAEETSADDRYRDIILITDGEDQESFPIDAATAAGKRGVRLIAIGLGSPDGSAVPSRDDAGRTTELTYDGKPVRTRLDPQSLQKIAAATPGGVFLNVGTGNIELDRVYRRLVESSQRRTLGDESALRYTEGFQVFLAAALVLLMLESFIHETPRRR